MRGTAGSRSYPIKLHFAIYGALIVCPLLIVGMLLSNLYVSKERRTLEAGARAIVREATAAIDRELDRYRTTLWVLSASDNLARGNLKQFYLQAKAFSDKVPDSSVALRRPDGQAIFATNVPWGTAPTPFLGEALRSADRRAIESLTPVVSDLLMDSTSGDPQIAVEQPVLADGEVTYLLTIAISPTGIRNIVQSQLEGSGWLLRVVDNNKLNIARSWDGQRFAGSDGDRFAGTRQSVAFIENAIGNAGSFTSTTSEGIPVFNAYLRSDLSGWRVGAGIPISDLEAPLYRSIFVLTVIAGLGLGSSLLLAVFYGRFPAKPLHALHTVAFSTGQGGVAAMRTGITELDGAVASLARFIMPLRHRERVQGMNGNEINRRVRNTLPGVGSMSTGISVRIDGSCAYVSAGENTGATPSDTDRQSSESDTAPPATAEHADERNRAITAPPTFICYATKSQPSKIVPARADRDWMNATYERFALRCLPLSIANASGWELLCPVTFRASWHGGILQNDMTFATDGDVREMQSFANSHFGHGILTLDTGYLFRTSPGWALWVRGSPNAAKDDIVPVEGLVETDWLPFPFTMNWRFARPGTVCFEKGEPFCFITPVPHAILDSIEPVIRDLSDDPELAAACKAWGNSRLEFNARLLRKEPEAIREGWQRSYVRGENPYGPAPTFHVSKRRLKQPRFDSD